MTGPGLAVGLSALAAGTAAALLTPSRYGRLRRESGPERSVHRPAPAAGRDSTARAVGLPTPLVLDLIAALLDAGSPPSVAVTSLGAALTAQGDARGDSLTQFAVSLGQGSVRRPVAGRPRDETLIASLTEALHLAVLSGMPPAGLVRRAAQEERRRRSAAQRRALRRLEVLLVLPVGLCLLPAFVLLGIAPMVIDLLSGI